MKLLRKINKAQWKQNDICNGASVSGDAITNCLNTKKNSLSTWEVTEETYEKGILAIIYPIEHIDSIDVVVLSSDELVPKGVQIKQTPESTTYQEYEDKHYDLINLNYQTLGTVSEIIVQAFKENRVERITRGKLLDILRKSIIDGVISKSDLQPDVQKYI